MIYQAHNLPEELIQDQARLNALVTERINNLLRSEVRTKEDALRRGFRAHGWREWIEVHENQRTFGERLEWVVVRRRPHGVIDWLRHKRWAMRAHLAIWRSRRGRRTR